MYYNSDVQRSPGLAPSLYMTRGMQALIGNYDDVKVCYICRMLQLVCQTLQLNCDTWDCFTVGSIGQWEENSNAL